MTRKQAAQKQRDDWRLAVTEGRVVRYGDGSIMKSFATPEAAQAAATESTMSGLYAAVVKETK